MTDEGWTRRALKARRLVAVADDDGLIARYLNRRRLSNATDARRVEDLAHGYAVELGRLLATTLGGMTTEPEARWPIVLEQASPPSMNVVVPLAALQRPNCG